MQVRNVLTSEVERIPSKTSIREAARCMQKLDVGAVPVFEGDRLVGMVTDRDIAIRAFADGCDPDSPVREIMSGGIEYCYDDDDVSSVARQMRDKKIRRLVVLNRDKRLVGIVSLGDVALSGDDRSANEALKGVSQGH